MTDRTDNGCGTLALQLIAQIKNRKETSWKDPGIALEAIAKKHSLAGWKVFDSLFLM